jgi:hypothetical protein
MSRQRFSLAMVLAIMHLASLACDPSDYLDDVEATEWFINQTANAAVAEFDAEAAQAETAILHTLTAEALTTNQARLALTPSATPTLTPSPTSTPSPSATPTPSPTATPAFSALLTIADDGSDNIICVDGSSPANPSPVADIGAVILSSDVSTATFRLDFPGLTDLASAASTGLHEVGIGLYDPAHALPPEEPAQFFSGLGNQFFASARFGAGAPFTIAVQRFRDDNWQGESVSDVIVALSGNSLEIAAPVSYFPAAGVLFLYTGYAGECDTVGLSPDRQLVIQFAKQDSGLVFRAEP